MKCISYIPHYFIPLLMIPGRKSMVNTIVERTPLKDRPGEMLYEIVLTMPQMSMI